MSKMKLHLKHGALHRELGVKEGQKIPREKLLVALHSNDPLTRKRAQFAVNASKWHH